MKGITEKGAVRPDRPFFQLKPGGELRTGRNLIGVAGAVVACLAVAVTALAAAPALDSGPNGERLSVSMVLAPKSGPLYRDGGVPADLRVNVELSEPGQSLPRKILPSKVGVVRLPPDLSFHPKASMPVCSDRKMSPATNLSIPPADAIALCPRSVIGNGTAGLYMAAWNTTGRPTVTDTVLIIFHAGETAGGRPKIKIYGYSKQVNAGVLMQGTLRADNSIRIAVPVLPADTAIGRYDLNVPGKGPVKYQQGYVPGSQGLDPTYVMASCSGGSWRISSEAILGTRNDAGEPTGSEYLVAAPDLDTPCEARPGRPPIGRLSVQGPARIRKGKSAIYRVRVKNYRGVDVQSVRVAGSGFGVHGGAVIGLVPAGKARSSPVRLRFSRPGRVRVEFRVTGRGGSPATVAKTVTVR